MMVHFLRPLLVLSLVLALALVSGHQATGRGLAKGAIWIELCQDGSLVTVTLDAEGKPLAQHHACPDCVLAGLAVETEAPALPVPLAQSRPVRAATVIPGLGDRDRPRPLARGPPVRISV